jgi:hypothetical protein
MTLIEFFTIALLALPMHCFIGIKKPPGGWNADLLSDYMRLVRPGQSVVDPERILSDEALRTITEIFNEMKDLPIRFVLTSKIHNLYWSYKNSQIDGFRFLQDLRFSSRSLDFNRDDCLIIFFSLVDDIGVVAFGDNLKDHLSDEVCRDIVATTERRLRVDQTDHAFILMFEKIKAAYNTTKAIGDFFNLLWTFVWLGGLFAYLNKTRKEGILKQRISAIKKLESSGMLIHGLPPDICPVCLTSLYSTIDTAEMTKLQPLVKNPIITYSKKCVNKEIQRKKSEPSPSYLLRSNVMTMSDCDHRFHDECFDLISVACKNCPLHPKSVCQTSSNDILQSIQVTALEQWYSKSEIKFYYRNDRLPHFADIFTNGSTFFPPSVI